MENDKDFCPFIKGDCESGKCAFFGGIGVMCMLQRLLTSLDFKEDTEREISEINEKLSLIGDNIYKIGEKLYKAL